jgi:cell division protein FtsB
MKRQRDSIKPEYEQRISDQEEKLAKTRKDNENLRAQNKKCEKERADALKKLGEN